MLTRFAPSPSGELHFGNFCNLIIIVWYARSKKMDVKLRIDDFDIHRSKDEYIENILRVVDKCKIQFDIGPSSIKDFKKNYSQLPKKELYWEELEKIKNSYVCNCSRSELKQFLKYPKICTYKKNIFEKCKSQLRYNVENASIEMGDFVLWRKEDIPSYLWVSFCEDKMDQVTHVIRGQDLYDSSMAQLHLAKKEKLTFLKKDHFLHHRLITEGLQKLSKTKNAPGILPILNRQNGLESLIHKFCTEFSFPLMNLAELLNQDFPGPVHFGSRNFEE